MNTGVGSQGSGWKRENGIEEEKNDRSFARDDAPEVGAGVATGSPSNDSATQLQDLVASPESRFKLVQLLAITAFLDNCIVDSSYRLSDSWASAIRLSELGNQIATAVSGRRARLKPNDVRMAVFLEVGCADGLLLDLGTDTDALRAIISDELMRRRIQLPYIFGRELHDLAAQLFPEKTNLNNSQTVRLLKDLPIGVFQVGQLVTGPFGCLTSTEMRQMLPSKSVPGYLCSDATCQAIHALTLATGASSVGKTRRFVDEYIQEHHAERYDEHPNIVNVAGVQVYDLYNRPAPESLFEVLADGLSIAELRRVTDLLLRRVFRKAGVQKALSKQVATVIGSPTDFVATLERPELLQTLLLFKDQEVEAAVDEGVDGHQVEVHEYELRVRKYARWDAVLSSEIGSQGVRLRGPASSTFVADKLFSLLYRLYYRSSVLEPADLGYLLGVPGDISEQQLLDHAIRTLSPERIIRELVVGNRRAATEASAFLGISDPQQLGRDDLVKRLLWKLGVANEAVFTDLARMEAVERQLTALPDASTSSEVVRGYISNLFAALEDALQRSLQYCAWILTVDHFLTQEGFVWDPESRSALMDFLQKEAPANSSELELDADGKSTLVPLAAGFSRLAKGLKGLNAAAYVRPVDQAPQMCRVEGRPFAFTSTLPFLNLADKAQQEVIDLLKEISKLVQDQTVIKVRNSTIHGNNVFPSSAEVALAVEKLANCRSLLWSSGLFPRTFRLAHTTEDALGREEFHYENGADSVSLYRPEWAIAPRMPIRRPQLLIAPICKTISSGPLRFDLKSRPGRDPYWEGWPKRWRITRQYTPGERTIATNDIGQERVS